MKILKTLVAVVLWCYVATYVEPPPPPAPLPKPDPCLVSVVYREARGEPLEGQRAVLDVVANRVKATGKTACEVLREPHQFQWMGWKKFGLVPVDATSLALYNAASQHPPVLKDEKFFFNIHLRPSWSRAMLCHRIGHHNFCRSKP